MKTLLFYLGLLGAALGTVHGQSTSSIREAIRQAQSQDKLILTYFSADFCHVCQSFDRSVLASSEFRSFLEREVVLLRLNYEDTSADKDNYAETYQVSKFPTFRIHDKDFSPVAEIKGSLDPDTFIGNFNAAKPRPHSTPSRSRTAFRWHDSLESGNRAIDAAGAEKAIIYFSAVEWCPPCMALNDDHLGSRRFAQFCEANNIVAIQLDTPAEGRDRYVDRKLDEFDVDSFPTVILFENGREIRRYQGYDRRSRPDVIAAFRRAFDDND